MHFLKGPRDPSNRGLGPSIMSSNKIQPDPISAAGSRGSHNGTAQSDRAMRAFLKADKAATPKKFAAGVDSDESESESDEDAPRPTAKRAKAAACQAQRPIQPLEKGKLTGRWVLSPTSQWPDEPCDEESGRGWRAKITSEVRGIAGVKTVRFTILHFR